MAVVDNAHYDAYFAYPDEARPWKERLERELQRRGLRTFSDSALLPGDPWETILNDGLNRSSSLVVIWTQDTEGGKGVRLELEKFLRRAESEPNARLRVIPVFLGEGAVARAPESLSRLLGVRLGAEAYREGPTQRGAAWARLVDEVFTAVTRPQGRGSGRLSRQSRSTAPSWDDLASDVQAALAWAVASERGVVGTRALLFGLLKTRPRDGGASNLLRATRRSETDLLDRLATTPPLSQFDPKVVHAAAIKALPRTTSNAHDALATAKAIRDVHAGPNARIEHNHLLAGLLLVSERSSVFSALAGLIGQEEISTARGLLELTLEEPGSFSLDEIFEEFAPTDAAATTGDAAIPPGESARFHARPSTSITSDASTSLDSLEHGLYADAVARFILDPTTRAPLTIGIKARWGAGKTSLMRMIRDQLDDPATRRRTPSGAANAPKRLRVFEVLRRTRAGTPDEAADYLEPEEGAVAEEVGQTSDQRLTIWFNAWKYQSSEQLWAGLAHAILSEIGARLSAQDSDRLWASLQIRRTDLPKLRRAFYRYIFLRALPFLAVAPLSLAMVGLLAITSPALLGEAALGAAVSSVAAAAFGLWKAATDNVKRALPGLVEKPDYEEKLGYLHLVDSDMRRILDLAGATVIRPFVVFIDDLDRCSYQTVAEVIEALNVFLAGDFDNCVFIIAMEPDLVAAQIHTAHADLFARLGDDADDFGWRFLEKMVQLPLSLPGPSPLHLERYVDGVLGIAGSLAASGYDDESKEVAVARRFIQESSEPTAAADDAEGSMQRANDAWQASDTLVGANAPGVSHNDRAALLRQAARLEFADKFSDIEARDLIVKHATGLTGNPREIKRFINVLRFYAYIDFWRRTDGLPSPGIEGAAKLARLAVGWPSLLTEFTADFSTGTNAIPLLQHLEAIADDLTQRQTLLDSLPPRTRAALKRDGRLWATIQTSPRVGEFAPGFV